MKSNNSSTKVQLRKDGFAQEFTCSGIATTQEDNHGGIKNIWNLTDMSTVFGRLPCKARLIEYLPVQGRMSYAVINEAAGERFELNPAQVVFLN